MRGDTWLMLWDHLATAACISFIPWVRNLTGLPFLKQFFAVFYTNFFFQKIFVSISGFGVKKAKFLV